MVIQNIDYPNFQKLIAVIEKKKENDLLKPDDFHKILEQATENGISKEEVTEVLDLLEVSTTALA